MECYNTYLAGKYFLILCRSLLILPMIRYSAFCCIPLLQNCFLCRDRWNGTWNLHSLWPCYVALGWDKLQSYQTAWLFNTMCGREQYGFHLVCHPNSKIFLLSPEFELGTFSREVHYIGNFLMKTPVFKWGTQWIRGLN